LRLGTLVPMNIEVPTNYQLSHNDRIVVFENRLHSKSPMLYKPGLHGNWNALNLARRALKDKFPTPTVPLTAVLPNRQVFLPDPVQLQIRVHAARSVWA
jgi:galactose mutarotase-like enzyme